MILLDTDVMVDVLRSYEPAIASHIAWWPQKLTPAKLALLFRQPGLATLHLQKTLTVMPPDR
jgi:hypothetical protein